jgi:hypothetical protein
MSPIERHDRGATPRRLGTAARFALAAVGATALACAGCRTVPPWERARLGDYLMRPDRDPLTESLSDHVYFTREAATGGRGVGGGGCGCN